MEVKEKPKKKSNCNYKTSDTECDYSESTEDTNVSNSHPVTSVIEESSTSVSEDDSLGLLSEEQLKSAWYDDSETDELISNCQNLKFDVECDMIVEFPQNFSLPNLSRNEELEISPICAREKSSTIDLFTLESTPKIKQSVQDIIDKSSTRYLEEGILNKTVEISSICYDVPKETNFTSVKSDDESNLECNILNITHHIETQDIENETSLNKTFGIRNILNVTLPSVISSMEIHSNINYEENLDMEKNIQNKTFTESPKDPINETRCEPQKYELPVEAKHSQKMLSRTVTKIKNKKTKRSTENNPTWTAIDSVKFSYPQTSISPKVPSVPKFSEDKFSHTGTKKVFKSDGGSQRLRKNSPKTDVKKTQMVMNKPGKILSATNRDLKILDSSSLFDTNSSMSSRHCIDTEIPPHNINTISRGNKNILPKKVPINLSFKKIEKEAQSQEEKKQLYKDNILLKNEDHLRKQKESAKLKGYADYKERESVEIPTIRLVQVPDIQQRKDQRISRLPRRSLHIGRPQLAQQARRLESLPLRMPGECRRTVLPLPGREPVHHTPQRMPGDYHRMPLGRGHSRIPTVRQEAFGPQENFGIGSPFDPPLRGRSSTIPEKSKVPNKRPFQK